MQGNISGFSAKVIKLKPAQIQRLDGNCLDIPPGSPICVESVNTGEKYWMEVIGMKNGEYVALQPPLMADPLECFPKGDQVSLCFVRDEHQICGFKSRISHVSLGPTPLLFVDFPDLLEVLSMRSAPRILCALPATLELERSALGAVLDISTSGCKFVMQRRDPSSALPAFGLNAELSVSVTFPGVQQPQSCGCQVRKSALEGPRPEGKERLELGLEFCALSEDAESKIRCYIETISAIFTF